METVIFNGSPHSNGITDNIVQYLTQHIPDTTVFYARKNTMRGCINCGYCKNNTMLDKEYTSGSCTISRPIDVQTFTLLLNAKTILFIAPIYFYHLPAITKSIIDRTQALYYMKQRGISERYIYPILHSGKERGEKLFEGTLLTLRYFAQALGSSLREPLLLRGTDSINASEVSSSYGSIIREYCEKIEQ